MTEVLNGGMLPEQVKAIALLNESGEPTPLGKVLEGQLTVMIFLRHFGCLACQEHVALWKPHLHEFDRAGAKVVFVGNGKPEHLRAFIDKMNLSGQAAAVLTEPTQQLHKALNLTNSIGSTIGPTAVINALRAVSRGNFQSSVKGDALQQGGLLIVDQNGRIALLHRERTLGDYLDISEVLKKTISLSNSSE